ncbi:MAG: hypothetical protein HOE90_00240 [Bacteriovoracaceae bacterium]|jgi:hypothetical protein|nr:hypothetical protein [Bacteriovoracaceae bacterium]
MFYLNLEGLILHLKNEKNNQRESFLYLLYSYLLFKLIDIFQLFYPSPKPDSFNTKIGGVVIIVILSMIFCSILRSYYQSNGGNNGRFFLHRIISLWFVLTLRISLVTLPAFLLLLLASKFANPALMLFAGLIGMGVCLASVIYILIKIKRSLSLISTEL